MVTTSVARVDWDASKEMGDVAGGRHSSTVMARRCSQQDICVWRRVAGSKRHFFTAAGRMSLFDISTHNLRRDNLSQSVNLAIRIEQGNATDLSHFGC